MEPTTAFWYLSTITQASAAIFGLLLVAGIFFIENVLKISKQYADIQNKEARKMAEIFVPGTKPFSLIVVIFICAIYAGFITILCSILALREIGNVVTPNADYLITNSTFLFFIFIILTFLFAMMSLMSLISVAVPSRRERSEKQDPE